MFYKKYIGKHFEREIIVIIHRKMSRNLLSVDDLKPLLHFAALCAPALVVSDQGDIRVFGDAVVTSAAVNTPSIIVVITQVFIAKWKAATVFY